MNENGSNYFDDEIDVREIFVTLWRGKWIIALFIVVFAIMGVTYALGQPNKYQANALLVPAQGDGGGRIGGQLTGLASLAGVNLGGGDADKTVIAKETLQSRSFIADFIHRHDLAAPLMGAKAWDVSAGEWIFDEDIYDESSRQWLTDENGHSKEPSDWDLVNQFREKLSVSENKDNGLLTVSIKSLSPVVARDWVEKLVSDINEHMRAQDVKEAEARIEFLKSKLRDTSIAGMQQVFYQLIETETRTVMLANAQREYVFKTIDPAVVPQEKSEPKRALIAIAAAMLGGMLGVLAVFVLAFIRSGKEQENLKALKDSK